MKLLLALLLLPTLVFASNFDLTEDDLNPSSQDVLIKKPEKYLRDESMIYDLNTDLGIKDQRTYTGADRNRFSVAGHVNSGYEHPASILGFDASIMHRSTRYNQVWYGAQIFNHSAEFGTITRNSRGSSSNSGAESNFDRPSSQKENILAGGLGAGYRFKLLLDFFETEDWFETVDVYVNYLRLNENFIKREYRGYGLTANYGLHKRVGSMYFYGFKLSYNVASVTRTAINQENESDRSLSLGWMTAALELGFFF